MHVHACERDFIGCLCSGQFLMFPELKKEDVIIRMSENINANICLLSLTFIEKNQGLNNFHS